MRTLDATAINRIANDPCVRPWLGGSGELNLSGVAGNPENFVFLTKAQDGAYVLNRLDLGLYEAHSLALPSARGRPMLELMRDGFRYMFTATEAVEIVTKVPDGNRMAHRWAEVAGFRETERREACFDLNGEIVGVSFRSLTYQEWVCRDPRNKREGELFHERLESAKGSPIHDEDARHDAWVGATIEGIRAGNIRKAVALYARHAAQVGYYAPQILSETPPTLFQGDAVVSMLNGEPCILKVIDAPEG